MGLIDLFKRKRKSNSVQKLSLQEIKELRKRAFGNNKNALIILFELFKIFGDKYDKSDIEKALFNISSLYVNSSNKSEKKIVKKVYNREDNVIEKNDLLKIYNHYINYIYKPYFQFVKLNHHIYCGKINIQ